MPSLRLEAVGTTLDLDSQLRTGTGVQVHSGVTGLGLPPVSTQWLDGAGDGSTYRGKRVLARDIDLPISVLGKDRAHLKDLLRTLALMLDQECKLVLVEDDGTEWYSTVRHVGGGNYVYGVDTDGEREASMVLTLRAGDPYWDAKQAQQVKTSPSAARPMLPKLVNLKTTSSSTIGTMALENLGDAPSHPVWVVQGPGDNFKAVSPAGEVLHWTGSLSASQTLTIDTKAGTVLDGTGANRYAELAPAPRMWTIPPGLAQAEVSFLNTSTGTYTAGGELARNLVANPSFETDVTGWNASLANRDTTRAFVGSASLRMDKSESGNLVRQYTITLDANTTYTFSAWWFLDTGYDPSAGVSPYIDVVGPNGYDTGNGSGPSGALAGQWQRVTHTFTTTVAGTYNLRAVQQGVGARVAWLDAVMCEVGSTATTYFDGDTPDTTEVLYDWTGTPHNSPSVKRTALVSGRSSVTCSWRPRRRLVI